jgi:hypothetical protein
MLGVVARDEDPLPPNGANPHPLPPVDQGLWHDEHETHNHDVIMGEANVAPSPAHAGSPHAAPAAGVEGNVVVQLEPIITPQQNVNQEIAKNEIIEIMQFVEPISALTGMISSIVSNAT